MISLSKAANVVGAGSLLVGAALAALVHHASYPLPPPTDPLEREAVSPYHAMEDYRRVDWYHDEEGYSSTDNLKEKVALITGGSSGIGLAVAEELCRLGVTTVTITSRSLERGQMAADKLVQKGSCKAGQVMPMELDLADLDAVREFATEFRARVDTLDYFVQNAGGAIFPPMDSHKFGFVTTTGHEYTYVGNYLGHFLLLNLLLDVIESSGPSSIAVTSSNAHWAATDDLDSLLPTGSKAMRSLADDPSFGNAMEQYGNTKLLQIHMCFELQRRLGSNTNVTVTPLSPGWVNTNLGHDDRDGSQMGIFLAQPPQEGAKTTLHALLSPSMKGAKGYFLQPYWSPLHRDRKRAIFVLIWEFLFQRISWAPHLWLPRPDTHRKEFAHTLWEESLKAVGLSD